MSQFQVYTEAGITSKPFDTLEDAKRWAHKQAGSNSWFEVLDLVLSEIVYTAEDYPPSKYLYCKLVAI